MSANFNPTLNKYKIPRDFRFWCQKVIPLVYDDSLSYYEVLCKVVNYINHLIKDDKLMAEDIIKLNSAFLELQDYVNKYFSEYQNRAFISYENYINGNNYMNEMPDLNECLINNTYRLLFTSDEINNNTCTLNMPSGLNWSNKINPNCNFGIIKNIDNFTTDEDKDNGYLNTQLFIFVDRENNKVNLFVRTKTVETKTTTTEILNGETVEVTRTTTQYTDWTDLFKNVNNTLESLQSQISAEVDRATNAENALGERLDAETEARTQADDVLTESIKRVETESAERDMQLGNQINSVNTSLSESIKRVETESTERDVQLGNQINTVNTSLSQSIKKVESDSAERDEQLGDRIDNLNTALDNEISRATDAENTITTNLNNEISRAQDAESELETKISNEVVRAQNIENGLRTDIDDEVTRANDAERKLSDRIDNLSGDLSDDIGNLQEKDDNLQEQIDNLTTIAGNKNVYTCNGDVSDNTLSTVDLEENISFNANDVIIIRITSNTSEGDYITHFDNGNNSYKLYGVTTESYCGGTTFKVGYYNILVYDGTNFFVLSDGRLQHLFEILNHNISEVNEKIENEITDRKEDTARVAQDLQNEVTRATEAENNLSERIDSETEARTQGDDLLTEKINDEVTRATQKENDLENQIEEISNENCFRVFNTVPTTDENYIIFNITLPSNFTDGIIMLGFNRHNVNNELNKNIKIQVSPSGNNYILSFPYITSEGATPTYVKGGDIIKEYYSNKFLLYLNSSTSVRPNCCLINIF